MPAPRSQRRARLAALVSVALAVTGLQFFAAPPAAQANPGGTALVISEVYGGGGNSRCDVHARLRRAVQPDGRCDPVWRACRVQYRSAASTAAATAIASVTALTGSVPAGGYYLVQTARPVAPTGSRCPTADCDRHHADRHGARGGQICLANTTTGVDRRRWRRHGRAPTPAIIDMVGCGSNANTFETATATAGAVGNTDVCDARNAVRRGHRRQRRRLQHRQRRRRPRAPRAGCRCPLTDPANKTGTVGSAITSFTLAATGGTPPYTWTTRTTLPPGVTSTPATAPISGTPDHGRSTYDVTVTVTDSAPATAGDGHRGLHLHRQRRPRSASPRSRTSRAPARPRRSTARS